MPVDYSAVLADLKERRNKLTVAILAIEEIVGTPSAPAASPVHVDKFDSPFAKAVRQSLSTKPGTVATLAYELIQQNGGPMKVADITQALGAMGKFKKIGRGNYGTVYGALTGDTRFVKVGEGEFEIRPQAALAAQPGSGSLATEG